jgi:polyisoprenoid-binding protein YceI
VTNRTKEAAMSQIEQGSRTVGGVELPPPGSYTIDPVHSSVGFVARHLMVTKVKGQFKKFSGTIEIAEVPEESHVSATVEAASIDTGEPNRDNHVRSADFLDVEHYPNITFESTKLVPGKGAEFKIEGNLTVHGVTRPITLDAEYQGVIVHPQMGTRMGGSAPADIDRDEFGVSFNAALETGGFVVSKIIKLEIEVEATAAQG